MSNCRLEPPRCHNEKGTPFPYWLDYGFTNAQDLTEHCRQAEKLFSDTYSPLRGYSCKSHFGRQVMMFRTIEDRTLFEVSSPSSKNQTRVDPPIHA